MTERPIIFDAESMRAIIAGTRTQFRRRMKPQPLGEPISREKWSHYSRYLVSPCSPATFPFALDGAAHGHRCPFGVVGDLLWCRETWSPDPKHPRCRVAYRSAQKSYGLAGGFAYIRDDSDTGLCFPEDFILPDKPWGGAKTKWRSSSQMPRWASRVTLEITDVRVQRVQDITSEDAWVEGSRCACTEPVPMCSGNIATYREQWDALNAKRGYPWLLNPWVWAISFKIAEVKHG